jgi:hypothetical protein
VIPPHILFVVFWRNVYLSIYTVYAVKLFCYYRHCLLAKTFRDKKIRKIRKMEILMFFHWKWNSLLPNLKIRENGDSSVGIVTNLLTAQRRNHCSILGRRKFWICPRAHSVSCSVGIGGPSQMMSQLKLMSNIVLPFSVGRWEKMEPHLHSSLGHSWIGVCVNKYFYLHLKNLCIMTCHLELKHKDCRIPINTRNDFSIRELNSSYFNAKFLSRNKQSTQS